MDPQETRTRFQYSNGTICETVEYTTTLSVFHHDGAPARQVSIEKKP